MLHNLIDNFNNLQKAADTNYRSIEAWYRYTDSGHTVNYPMNVGDMQEGISSRPCQKNAFILARKYYKFAVLFKISDFASINESCEFFCDTFNIVEDSDKNNDEIIPFKFLDTFTAFHDALIEFKHMFDLLKDDQISNEISLRALFEKQINYFYEKGFQYQQIQNIIEQIIQGKEKGKGSAQISIETTLKIDECFNYFKKDCFWNWSEDSKTSSLTKYLIQLSDLFLIDQFKAVLIEHEYTVNYAKDIVNISHERWKKIGFFAEGEEEHRQQFAPVLGEINKMVKKF